MCPSSYLLMIHLLVCSCLIVIENRRNNQTSIIIETHGMMKAAAYDFFHDVGCQISEVTGDAREVAFIFQRLSVLIQWFNSALFSETFTMHDHSDF